MKNRLASRNKGMIFLIAIVLIVVMVAVGFLNFLRVDAIEESLKNEKVIKTLFVMEDESQVFFTDIFIYYPEKKRGALINIPGNTGAIFKSLGRVDRIDTVYKEKGIDTYKTEIENLIGQSIQFYVVFNLNMFSELCDMLGGLKIFISSPVDVTDDDGVRYLLPSGVVNLDGDKIKTYLTYKNDSDESEISERRQNVLLAFFTALSQNKTSYKLKNKKSFALLSQRMSTNLDSSDFYNHLNQISQVDTEHLVPRVITGSNRLVDGKVLLFPFYDGALIKDLVREETLSVVNDGTNIGRAYVLEVQNGTEVQGLARNTALLLQGFGYDVFSTKNADSSNYEKTMIINHIGNKEMAKRLGDFILCSNIVDEDVLPESADNDANANIDFTIIIGKDFDGRYVKSNGGK